MTTIASVPDSPTNVTTPEPCIHIVDDEPSVLESLAYLLGTTDRKVRTHRTAADFLRDFDHEVPGCILLDLQFAEDRNGGLAVLRELSNRRSRVPVIMISAHGRVPIAVEALHLGAIDFLEKSMMEDHIVLDIVRRAVDHSVRMWPVHRELEAIQARRETLTARQMEVLHLVVAGLPSRSIADRLGVTEGTIEAHRQEISKKMQATNVSQLVRMIMSIEPPLTDAE